MRETWQSLQLHQAASKGRTPLLKRLLAEGINPDIAGHGYNWIFRAGDNKSALYKAVSHSNLEAAQLLLDAGASVDSLSLDFLNPLDVVATKVLKKLKSSNIHTNEGLNLVQREMGIISLLLKSGASLSPNGLKSLDKKGFNIETLENWVELYEAQTQKQTLFQELPIASNLSKKSRSHL